MGPQPREFQLNCISLYKLLGIVLSLYLTTSKKFHFYTIHIVLDEINVNLTELGLDLVNFVGSPDPLQGVRGYYPNQID